LRRSPDCCATFPEARKAVIRQNLPIFERRSVADQAELLEHVQVFLGENISKAVPGSNSQMRFASQSPRKHVSFFSIVRRITTRTILIYPSAYVAREDRYLGANIWEQGEDGRLGHTGRRMGSLVLAWDAAKRGAADPADGANLMLHEFAHQLDFEDSQTDGAPALRTRGEYLPLARVMSREFQALQAADKTGAATILDTDGAKNPAEFLLSRRRRFSSALADFAQKIRSCMRNLRRSIAKIRPATPRRPR
jgi:Mlc titration factor MtfA (ptsG expression regulator)